MRAGNGGSRCGDGLPPNLPDGFSGCRCEAKIANG